MTPEAKIKKLVKEILKEVRAYYAMPVSGGYGNSGVPDFLICLQGRFVGIECKANGNDLTDLQRKNLREIESAGGHALVIDETNVDMLKAILLVLTGGK